MGGKNWNSAEKKNFSIIVSSQHMSIAFFKNFKNIVGIWCWQKPVEIYAVAFCGFVIWPLVELKGVWICRLYPHPTGQLKLFELWCYTLAFSPWTFPWRKNWEQKFFENKNFRKVNLLKFHLAKIWRIWKYQNSKNCVSKFLFSYL